jgi:hypothetical protein
MASTAPVANDDFTVTLPPGTTPGLGYSTTLAFKNVYISSIEESSPLLDDMMVGDLMLKVNDVDVIDLSFDGVMNVLNAAILENREDDDGEIGMRREGREERRTGGAT